MAEITAAHNALDQRTKRAVRTIMKLAEHAGMRMDALALLRATVMDEVHGVADVGHSLLDVVVGEDVIVNDLYVEALAARGG